MIASPAIDRILTTVRALPDADAILHQTCLTAPDASWLEKMARECRGPVLEIGTRHGLTAALFAMCWHDVVTVDVVPSPHRVAVWDALGVGSRVVGSEDGTVPEIHGGYHCAFIDAVHTYEGCRQHWHDIEPHMAPGALLLFDDMDYRDGEGGRFWREMGAEQVGRFGRLVLP